MFFQSTVALRAVRRSPIVPKASRKKSRLSFVLAVILGFESLAPACWASEKDELGDAFRNFQKFARAAEQSTPTEAPTPTILPTVAEKVLRAHEASLNATSHGALDSAPEKLDLREPVFISDPTDFTERILGSERREFLHLVAELVYGADWRTQDTYVTITEQSGHHVGLSIKGQRKIEISAGTLARVRNLDEFAAILIRLVATEYPEVYAHRDDPRIMRRLEEQIAFGSLPEKTRRALKADLSTIERLRGMNLRPWGLTDFDRREFRSHDTTDPLYELRLLAQKIAVTYMQERENIRDLIKAPHEFSPGLRAIRNRALRIDLPRYAKQTFERHPRKILGATVLASAALTSQFVDSEHLRKLDPSGLLSWIGDSSILATTWGLLTSVFSAIWSVVVAVANAVFHAVSFTGSLTWKILNGIFDFLYNLVASVGGAIVVAIQFLWNWTAVLAFDWVLRPLGELIGFLVSSLANFVVDVLTVLISPILWFWGMVWENLYTIGSVYLAGALIALGLASYQRIWRALIALARGLDTTARGLGRGLSLLGTEVGKMGHAVKGGAEVFGGAFGRVGKGEVNRWRLRHALERRLHTAHPKLDSKTIMRSAAADLHYIHEHLKGHTFLRTRTIDEKNLRVLAGFYQVPRDFWSLLDQFLLLLEDQIRNREIEPTELAAIFGRLAHDSVPEFFEGSKPPSLAERALVFVMFDSDSYRPRMASIYRSLREAYPSDSISFVEIDAGTSPWKALDDTVVRGSTFLGLSRLAFEMENAALAPSAAQVVGLSQILFARLQRSDMLPAFLDRLYPVVSQQIFNGASSRSEADRVHAMFEWLRRDPGETAGKIDRWPSLPDKLGWTREMALLERQVGKAAAIATWEATSPFRAHALQFQAQVAHRTTKGMHRLTRNLTTVLLARKLASLESIREVSEYVEREVLDRGGRVEILTPFLYDFAVNHPELIKSREDVKTLLDHDYFWPTGPLPLSGVALVSEILRGGWRDSALDESMAESMKARQMSRSWRYHASLCGRLHRVIIQRLEGLGQRPGDYSGLLAFWKELTERGVTAETDRLMQELISISSPENLETLRNLAVKEQRVWEEDLHSRLSIADAKSNENYRKLIGLPVGHPERGHLLDLVISSLQTSLPERGLAYASFLEDLSVRINSTYDEAKTLSLAKADVGDKNVSDGSLNAVRDVFRKICDWPASDQFNFLKVLRNDEKAGGRVLASFPNVGVERIQRMYEILPLAARVGVLDSFLTHGLLKEGSSVKYWIETLSRHIVGGQQTEAQKVTLQVLKAFLFAVEKVGNRQMITTILSYLYALPNTQTASPVEVLKLVLEIFGATGIKVGQFTYASQILGPSGEILRTLQSRARVPERIEIYEDVYDLLGVPVGTPLPFLVLELLGAASMKYAFMGQDLENLHKTVIKVFRLDAMNNVDLQFDVLEHMGEYLVEHYGPRYGIFKIIIKSARRAVRREGSMRNEIRRSKIARHRIYKGRSTPEIEVEAPREDLVNQRMIIAQYAEGVTFEDLPDAAKPLFARALLEMENDIIFSDARVTRFDPDRHAGNAQLLFALDTQGDVVMRPKHKIGPIDFGQVLRLTRVQRERITKLFALAQMASRKELRPWTISRMSELLTLSPEQSDALAHHLPLHLEASPGTPVTLYVATLAALEASGFAIEDTTFIDFIRGIIQLTPFERWARDARAPSRTFEANVIGEIREYLGQFEWDPQTLRMIHTINSFRAWRGRILGGEVKLIPTDLSDISFDEMIQRDEAVSCAENLAKVG